MIKHLTLYNQNLVVEKFKPIKRRPSVLICGENQNEKRLLWQMLTHHEVKITDSVEVKKLSKTYITDLNHMSNDFYSETPNVFLASENFNSSDTNFDHVVSYYDIIVWVLDASIPLSSSQSVFYLYKIFCSEIRKNQENHLILCFSNVSNVIDFDKKKKIQEIEAQLIRLNQLEDQSILTSFITFFPEHHYLYQTINLFLTHLVKNKRLKKTKIQLKDPCSAINLNNLKINICVSIYKKIL